MREIHNSLINETVLNEYLKNNRREIFHFLTDRADIITNWKNKLEEQDNSNNFSREVPNYPYFQEHFLKGLLNYDHGNDWVYEDSNYTGEGVVEFTILDNSSNAILFIEIKNQNANLDLPQRGYGNRTPVQQAHQYAISNDNIVWYIVFNYDELRIYNKYESYLNDKYISFKMRELSEEDLFFLILLLGKAYFKEQRLIDEIKKRTLIVEEEITDHLYKLYHEIRIIDSRSFRIQKY